MVCQVMRTYLSSERMHTFCPPFLAIALYFISNVILVHKLSVEEFVQCIFFSNVILVHKFSVEEFVQTSNLGEFKRRLHLLLAFHGEISDGASVGAYSR